MDMMKGVTTYSSLIISNLTWMPNTDMEQSKGITDATD